MNSAPNLPYKRSSSRLNLPWIFMTGATLAFLPIIKLRDIWPTLGPVFAIAALMFAGLALLLQKQKLIFNQTLYIWLSLPLVLIFQSLISLMLGIVPVNSIMGNVVTVLGCMLLGIAIKKASGGREEKLRLILAGLSTLLILSTILYLVGVESQHQWSENMSRSSILSKFGLSIARGGFPLTGGATTHSSLAGIVIVGHLILRQRSIFAFVSIGVAIFGLLVGDGRAAMAAGVLALVYISVSRGAGLRFAPWLFLMTAPLFLILVQLLPPEFADSLARTGEGEELLNGNKRLYIWELGLGAIWHNPLALPFGFGTFGNINAGMVSSELRFMSGFHVEGKLLTMHNAGMQFFMDGGIFGLIVIIIFLTRLCRDLESVRKVRVEYRVASGMILYMILTGGFDVYMSSYNDDGFFALLLIAAIMMDGKISRKISNRKLSKVSGRRSMMLHHGS